MDEDLSTVASTTNDAFGAMVHNLAARVTDLQQLVALRGAVRGSDNMAKAAAQLQALSKRVVSTEASFLELKHATMGEEESIVELKALVGEAKALRDATNHMVENLPPHLPGTKPTASAPPAAAIAAAAEPAPVPKKRGKRLHAPMLAYVTLSELDGTPKYIKGRLDLDSLNSSVDILNGIVQAKYRLLSRPMTKLRGHDLKAYTDFCDQEDKQSEGRHFFADTDIRSSEDIKMDATTKAVLGTLFHMGRLKKSQLRGVGRYFVVP